MRILILAAGIIDLSAAYSAKNWAEFTFALVIGLMCLSLYDFLSRHTPTKPTEPSSPEVKPD